MHKTGHKNIIKLKTILSQGVARLALACPGDGSWHHAIQPFARMKLDEITSSNAFSNAIMLVIMVNVVLWLGS